jgi:hypothetical protein
MIPLLSKTDKPTDWKALWISFGDGAFSEVEGNQKSQMMWTYRDNL